MSVEEESKLTLSPTKREQQPGNANSPEDVNKLKTDQENNEVKSIEANGGEGVKEEEPEKLEVKASEAETGETEKTGEAGESIESKTRERALEEKDIENENEIGNIAAEKEKKEKRSSLSQFRIGDILNKIKASPSEKKKEEESGAKEEKNNDRGEAAAEEKTNQNEAEKKDRRSSSWSQFRISEFLNKLKPSTSEDEKKSKPETGDEKMKGQTETGETTLSSASVEKSSSGEGGIFPSALNESEKKALADLRSKIEESILGNKFFKGEKQDIKEEDNANSSKSEGKNQMKVEKDEEKKEEREKDYDDKKDKSQRDSNFSVMEDCELTDDESGKEKCEAKEEQIKTEETIKVGVNEEISLWGVSLQPSKGDPRTDVILLKFLKAREFKVDEAFEMLRNALQWRKQNNIDSILNESFGVQLESLGYMSGIDLGGHPICYNIHGLLGKEEIYNMAFGSKENKERLLRWRIQLMERGIQKLDFKPGGVSSLVQIHDLADVPIPSKKDTRIAMKHVLGTLQDNYPEFAEKNIFINVPFWYYAFSAIVLPVLTPRTKSKFVFARPSKVAETLLKYMPAEQVPARYGGLLLENDPEFFSNEAPMEVTLKSGSTERIEIPAPEAGKTLIWDLYVMGWDVHYKEEFVPNDEGSYSIIVQRKKRIAQDHEGPIRNSFKNKEPGKILLIIENKSFKRKRAVYRYKTKTTSSSSSSS